jgi:hypothetical protein
MRACGLKWGVLLAVALAALPGPARAEWYEEDQTVADSTAIVGAFTLKNFDLATGAGVTSWLAFGTDPKQTGLSFLARGGYFLGDTPLYLGLEVPLAFAKPEGNSGQFVIGNVGLGLKYRLDPLEKLLGIYTGWSLDVYLPTAWISDGDNGLKQGMAHGFGTANSLIAGPHFPESICISGTFSLILPGKLLFFQFDLTPVAAIPVADTKRRDTAGALTWGADVGVHIIKEMAFVLEIKGYTPIDPQSEDVESLFALMPGLRFDFGAFKPALWVSLPLNDTYRKIFPDAIIGLDLAANF